MLVITRGYFLRFFFGNSKEVILVVEISSGNLMQQRELPSLLPGESLIQLEGRIITLAGGKVWDWIALKSGTPIAGFKPLDV